MPQEQLAGAFRSQTAMSYRRSRHLSGSLSLRQGTTSLDRWWDHARVRHPL